MAAKPKYKIARMIMDLASGLGFVAILIGVIVAIGRYAGVFDGFTVAIAVGLILNGTLVIAAAQMGEAMLDTAVSTRETADTMAAILKQGETKETAPRKTPDIWAKR